VKSWFYFGNEKFILAMKNYQFLNKVSLGLFCKTKQFKERFLLPNFFGNELAMKFFLGWYAA